MSNGNIREENITTTKIDDGVAVTENKFLSSKQSQFLIRKRVKKITQQSI